MSSWYFNKNLKPQGPLSLEEIKTKIMRGELSPSDLLVKEGEAQWQPAMDWREFPREIFPAFQGNSLKRVSLDDKEWILLNINGESPKQEGPFSVLDIQKMQAAGEVRGDDYVWRMGLTGWVRICDRSELICIGNTENI